MGQSTCEECAAGCTVPGLQSVWSSAPVMQYEPSGHAVHSVADGPEHSLHVSLQARHVEDVLLR